MKANQRIKTKKKRKNSPRKKQSPSGNAVNNIIIDRSPNKKRKTIGGVISGALYSLVSNRTIQIVFSLVCALILSVSSYLMENQPYELSDRSFLFYAIEMPFRQWTHEFDQNVRFISVSHDKQLVPIDTGDLSLGNTDITDRGKLLRFFERLERDKVHYKAIMLDIRFEKDLVTDVDEALYKKISEMRDIVVAHHQMDFISGYEIADSIMLGKAGYADYQQVAYENDFFRYPFLQNQGPSLALRLYDMIRGQKTSIRKWPHLPVYWSNNHLCANSPLLPIYGDVYDKFSAPQKRNEKNNFDEHYNFYEDLGADWLYWEDRNWSLELDNAYIVIGDLENDVHDTYAGPRSGAFINWLAYLYLESGSHILSWSYVFFMFVFYFALIFMMFYMNNIARRAENRNNRWLLLMLSFLRWLGTIGLLYLITFLFYRIFHVRYNVTIPIVFIAIVNFIIQTAKKYKYEEIVSSDAVPSVVH